MQLYYYGLTDKGKIREINEDYFLAERLDEGQYIFAVADGMGGHSAGEVASKTAIRTLYRDLKNIDSNNIKEELKKIFENINKRLIKEGKKDLKKKGMGTTLSAVYIRDDELYLAHVGDSRIYLLSENKFIQLTEDHSFIGKLKKEGLISTKEAENHPKKNILYQSIGIKEYIKVQLEGPIKIKKGDKLFLCSDGLHGVVHDENIKKIMEMESTKISTKLLIDNALRKGGPDNITVVAVSTVEDKQPGVTKKLSKFDLNIKRLSGYRMLVIFFLFLMFLSVIFYSYSKFFKGKKNANIGLQNNNIYENSILKPENSPKIIWKSFINSFEKYSISGSGILYYNKDNLYFKNFTNNKKENFDNKNISKQSILINSIYISWIESGVLYSIKNEKTKKYSLREIDKLGIPRYLKNNYLVFEIPEESLYLVYDIKKKKKVWQLNTNQGDIKVYIFNDSLVYYDGITLTKKRISDGKKQEIPVYSQYNIVEPVYISLPVEENPVFWMKGKVIYGKKSRFYYNINNRIYFQKININPSGDYTIGETEKKQIYIWKGKI